MINIDVSMLTHNGNVIVSQDYFDGNQGELLDRIKNMECSTISVLSNSDFDFEVEDALNDVCMRC